jgi:Eco29kI restriction endonuclease
VEAALIKLNRPLWNSVLDGFGNHDPGKGRYEQANSDWDVIHQGRAFAEKLKGIPTSKDMILANIAAHMSTLTRAA